MKSAILIAFVFATICYFDIGDSVNHQGILRVMDMKNKTLRIVNALSKTVHVSTNKIDERLNKSIVDLKKRCKIEILVVFGTIKKHAKSNEIPSKIAEHCLNMTDIRLQLRTALYIEELYSARETQRQLLSNIKSYKKATTMGESLIDLFENIIDGTSNGTGVLKNAAANFRKLKKIPIRPIKSAIIKQRAEGIASIDSMIKDFEKKIIFGARKIESEFTQNGTCKNDI